MRFCDNFGILWDVHNVVNSVAGVIFVNDRPAI